MDKAMLIQAIQAEVNWCIEHKGKNKKGFSLDYEKGFIAGLNQAKKFAKMKTKPPKDDWDLKIREQIFSS